jgi:two-component system chemotaxis response regulator CheY
MRQKTKGQIEQEQAMQASGLLRDEIALLYEECKEKLAEVENDLMDIAQDRAAISQEFINRVFRAFHSVKGAAAYLLHEPMKRLSHAAENVLSEVREGKMVLTADLAEALLAAVSRLKEMGEDIDRELEIDFHTELESLNAILKPKSSARVELNLAASIDLGEAAPAVSNRTSSARRLKMLVVEDELTSRLVLQDLLSKYGECHVAVTGEEAVKAFRMALADAAPYELICMDIRMPGMDGVEAVSQIRAVETDDGVLSSNGVKIIMQTGVEEPKDVVASYHALCDAYLVKPIKKSSLLDALSKMGLIA